MKGVKGCGSYNPMSNHSEGAVPMNPCQTPQSDGSIAQEEALQPRREQPHLQIPRLPCFRRHANGSDNHDFRSVQGAQLLSEWCSY